MLRDLFRLAPLVACASLLAVVPAHGGPGPSGPTWFDIRSFGAVGDGSTDDTDALQDALNAASVAGGTVYVPPGNYAVRRSLQIAAGKIAVRCDAGSRLTVDAPGVKLLEVRGDFAEGGLVRDIRISGCTFIDPAPLDHIGLDESHGIVLRNVDGAILRDLRFENLGDESVDIIFSSNVKLLDSHAVGGCAAVSTAGAGTFSVNSSSRIQIRGCTIDQNRNGSAIRIEVTQSGQQSSHIVISENQIFDPQDQRDLGDSSGVGIVVVPGYGRADGVSLIDNQIVRPHRSGIIVTAFGEAVTSRLVIKGNLVLDGGQGATTGPGVRRGAIELLGAVSIATVGDNVIDGWGVTAPFHVGIFIVAQDVVVAGNVTRDVPGVGVHAVAAGSAIVGNIVGPGGVASDENDLPGLNVSDRSGAIRFDSLRNCAALRTDATGAIKCVRTRAAGSSAKAD